MDKRFLTSGDVSLRLDNGLVLYDGEPYRALWKPMPSNSDTNIWIYTIPDGHKKAVDANDPKLYTKSLELGYINNVNIYFAPSGDETEKHQAIFLYRGTNRKQKSVCFAGNTYIIHTGNKESSQISNEMLFSKGVYDMLKNNYPETRDFSNYKRDESIALSRNFAIKFLSKEQKLYFNGHEIGNKPLNGDHFNLYEGYDHSLMEMRLAGLNI